MLRSLLGLYLIAQMKNQPSNFLSRPFRIMAMAAQGDGLSGSDRIFLELSKRWYARGQRIRINVCQEGRAMCLRNGIAHELLEEWPVADQLGTRLSAYLSITVRAALRAWRLPPESDETVYSASDFWPDVVPALIRHLRTGSTWIAGLYLFAPAPWRGFEGSARRGLPRPEDLLYWLSQVAVLHVIRRRASVILVTGDSDKDRLTRQGVDPNRVVIVKGGVDMTLPGQVEAGPGNQYEAVFVGRLHVQKGVRQLLDIWSRVVSVRPSARLAIIGVGPLAKYLHHRVHELHLDSNVEFLGYLDGRDKVAVFKRSALVVHPALYDSGGMAACEAFSCGLPGVSFDLPELRTYYPQGMSKVPSYDLDAFAAAILTLLDDSCLRRQQGTEALALARLWDWDRRAEEVANLIDFGLAG